MISCNKYQVIKNDNEETVKTKIVTARLVSVKEAVSKSLYKQIKIKIKKTAIKTKKTKRKT